MKHKISIIVAVTNNNIIGSNNSMPWNLPRDMKYFINMTKNKVVIMGRNTFTSLNNKPLKNRFNIVITSNNVSNYDYDNLHFVNDINQAIKLANDKNNELYYPNNEIIVMGGSSIYKQFIDLNLVDKMYITRIDTNIDGDASFHFNESNYRLNSKSFFNNDEDNQFNIEFQEWIKI